ncbi:MAG TPA: hypothetical protein VF210_01875 [Pseudomonadales bacterium]
MYALTRALYAWAAILALGGYSAAYLNRPSASLTYLTDAVLPVYVLHQPVLLIAAYFVFPQALPVAVEAALLALITALGCLALYEVFIRRLRIARFLFGLKPRARSSRPDLSQLNEVG